METIDILKAKYGEQAPGAPEAEPGTSTSALETMVEQPPSTWRQSAAVVALSDFLKPRPWVRLVEYADASDRVDGYGLCFEPGISPRDPDRWADAQQAMILLADALEDIDHLRRIGRLPLPRAESPHPYGPPPAGPADPAPTGPSQDRWNSGVNKAL
jgi:hypothetical protein